MMSKEELCENGYEPEAEYVEVRSFDVIGWGPSGSILGGIPEQPIFGDVVKRVPVATARPRTAGRYGTLVYINNHGRPWLLEPGPLGNGRRALTMGGRTVSVRVRW